MLVTLADPKPSEEIWFGGRNGGIDVNSEWQPTDSWSFDRILRRTEQSTRTRFCAPDVKLHISVLGKRGKGYRLRPYTWYASVRFGSCESKWGSKWELKMGGKCKSVRQALRDALAHPDVEAAIARVLGRAYSPLDAECVYRKHEDRFVPWLTHLGIDWEQACWDWPNGDYQIRKWDPGRLQTDRPSVHAWIRVCSTYGMSGKTVENDDPEITCWLPNPYEKNDDQG